MQTHEVCVCEGGGGWGTLGVEFLTRRRVDSYIKKICSCQISDRVHFLYLVPSTKILGNIRHLLKTGSAGILVYSNLFLTGVTVFVSLGNFFSPPRSDLPCSLPNAPTPWLKQCADLNPSRMCGV